MTSHTKGEKDDEILALNNVGLSLTRISELTGLHHTTVLYRLRLHGVASTDTRRNFMEDIFMSLTADQQLWLANKLAPSTAVKDFVRSLIIQEYHKALRR